MPKWRTVSFVPGVTLNIEDSTSVEPMVRPTDTYIFPPRSSEYDIGKVKKIPAYLDLSVLASLTHSHLKYDFGWFRVRVRV